VFESNPVREGDFVSRIHRFFAWHVPVNAVAMLGATLAGQDSVRWINIGSLLVSAGIYGWFAMTIRKPEPQPAAGRDPQTLEALDRWLSAIASWKPR
jgi:hypothetical protein